MRRVVFPVYIIKQYEYDVFGRCTVHTSPGVDGEWMTADDITGAESAVGNTYMFTGRSLDAETGLYYYRTRYYKPEIGRFLQPDLIRYSDGLNMYAYCGNNPVNFVDPLGLNSIKERIIGIIGGAGWSNDVEIPGEPWKYIGGEAAKSYSRASQGVVNVFTGGLFDSKSGVFYNWFDSYNKWGGFGDEKNCESEAFQSGQTGGRISEGFLLAAGALHYSGYDIIFDGKKGTRWFQMRWEKTGEPFFRIDYGPVPGRGTKPHYHRWPDMPKHRPWE